MPNSKPVNIIRTHDIAAYLATNHGYFGSLPGDWKQRFIDRVADFIQSKHFDARDGFHLTPEMKISIAASAVQLTLGLETWDLAFFRSILVFPSDYRSPATGKLHKGEANMGGFLCFSWQAFQEGYAIPHDKINLGLHEFAHALRFNGVEGDPCDYFFEHYFARWAACADTEYHRLKGDIPGSIFRKYGGVNIEEFFSVVVETFFESPEEFKTALPDLYRETSILLNQTVEPNGVVPGCREALMAAQHGALAPADIPGESSLPRYRTLLVPAALLGCTGLIWLLLAGRHAGLFPYVLVAVAIASLIWVEARATAVVFRPSHLLIRKGILMARSVEVPYAQLVSLSPTGGHTLSVVYYHNAYFYAERYRFKTTQPALGRLCEALKQQGVAVA